MRLLVDGDIIVFRAGFACEKSAYFIRHGGEAKRFQYKKELDSYIAEHGLEGIEYEKDIELEPVGNALHTAGLMLQSFLEDLQCNRDDTTVFLSGPNNFRYGVATYKPYKGNRDAAHRPTHEQALKDYLVRNWNAVYSVDQEADDDIGIAQYTAWDQGEESIIVSLDKDLRMIPGMHFNFVKKESTVVNLRDANKNFWSQMVTGDTTDNIPGIPGAGPAAAKRLLAQPDHVQAIANEYKKAYSDDWRKAMTEMGRLLWIRRRPNEWWNIPEEVV